MVKATINASKFSDKADNVRTRERVNRYMEHYGVTTKAFATRCGITYTNFNQFSNGKRDLGGYSTVKINDYIDSMVGDDF